MARGGGDKVIQHTDPIMKINFPPRVRECCVILCVALAPQLLQRLQVLVVGGGFCRIVVNYVAVHINVVIHIIVKSVEIKS